MRFTSIFCGVVWFLFSCRSTQIVTRNSCSVSDRPIEKIARLKVFLRYADVTNENLPEVRLAKSAFDLFLEVVASQAFADSVAQASFTWEGVPRGRNVTMSNAAVLARLRSELSEQEKVVVKLDIRNSRWQNIWKSVIGFEDGECYTVHTYTWIIEEWLSWNRTKGVAAYAGHIGHEFCHMANFGHAFRSHSSRVNTVPYRVGQIIENIAKSEEWLRTRSQN
jgi:hypothetical protein